jgi:ABC-type glycerol-3-phosphate transport system substrate-binding protein
MVVFLALLLGSGLVVLSGCDVGDGDPTAVPIQATEPSVPSEPPQGSETPDSDETPTPLSQLTVWTTEIMSPTEAITSGQILAQVVAQFEEAHPDTSVRFIPKKPDGKGGILDFLLTTGTVVPDLLPDLVIINVDELPTAVQAGLVQPLNDLVSSDLIADLYPFARQSTAFDGQIYGLQFSADLEHLVYALDQVDLVPSAWPGVLNSFGPYIFPAGGQAGRVNDAFMIQYLAVRTEPSSTAPPDPFLEQNSLTLVLQYYRDGLARGIFPAEIVDYRTTDDTWLVFRAGQAIMSHVSAHRYLLEGDQVSGSVVAPIPTASGPGASIGHGWVVALVTADPERQELAVDMIERWMAPEVNGAWTRAASYLPTRQGALAFWGTGDYAAFAEQQLLTARPSPRIPNYADIAGTLQEAVEQVLSGAKVPEEAAIEAINKAQP